MPEEKDPKNGQDSEDQSKKIIVSVEDKRSNESRNLFFHPTVLAALVGAIAGLLTTSLTILGGNNQLTKLRSEASELSKYQVPVGTIVAYGGPIEPERRQELDNMGWLICDGSLIPEGEKYTPLKELLGENWGPGNRSNRVSLPNLQGLFLRGIDLNDGTDPDRLNRTNWEGKQVGPIIGSIQADTFQGHSHALHKFNQEGGGTRIQGEGGGDARQQEKGFFGGQVAEPTEFGYGTPRISSETRPKNAYVYYLIKY